MQQPDTDSELSAAPQLRRSIGLLDLVMLGAGSALGVSIFSVLAPAVKIAGTGVLLTIVIAALPMAVFGVVYAFLASASPRSGASFEWPREYLHPFVGFILAWLRIFGNVGQLTMIALVLVQYAAMAVPIPVKPTMLGLYVALFLLNVSGVKLAARAETVLMGLLLLVLAVFVLSGLPYTQSANILPLAPHGVWPILLAAPLMINLFMGIESSTEVGEEVRNARVNIPRAIALALLLIGLVYAAVTWVTLGLVGADSVAASDAPLVTAARRSVGAVAVPLVLAAAVLSLTKSLNASFLIFSRSFFAMGRAHVMPALFGRVDSESGTPRWAVAIAFGCTCVGLLMPRSLVFLFLASNIPIMLKYLTTCACALRVANFLPEVFSQARLKLSRRTVTVLAVLGILLAFGLFLLGYENDWRPYALVGGWGLLGVLYWLVWSRFAPNSRAQVWVTR